MIFSRAARGLLIRVSLCAGAVFMSHADAQVFAISAPENSILPGETIQLTPQLNGPDGNPVAASDWTWVSLTPSIVSVDAAGKLTGVGLGAGQIQLTAPAEAGAQFGFLQIQVQPKSVTITPASQTTVVGKAVQFSAVATDINDQPIPNANFTWYLTVEDGRTSLVPGSVTIGSDGTFTAGATGTFTVHADIYFPFEYGKPTHFEAFAQAVVTLPKTYSVSRLISSDPAPAKTLRPSTGFFAAANSGSVIFTASPDGLSTAVIGFDGANAQTLMNTGAPSPQSGGIVAGFQSGAMNSNGDALVAIKAGDVANGALLAVPRAAQSGSQPAWVLLDNANGIDINGSLLYELTYLHLTQYSLNDNGSAVIRALYRPQDATAQSARNGLFLLRSALSPNLTPLLVWSEDVSPGAPVTLTGTPPRFSIIEDNTEPQPGWMGIRGFGIDNNENIYFMAQAGSNRGLFVVRSGGTPQKLLALGDAFPGNASKVKSIQDLVITSVGDLAMRVDLQNGEVHVVLFQNGKYSSDLVIAGSSNMRVLAASSAGVLFEGIPVLKGTEGLYLWTKGSKTAASVLPISATVKYISTATIDSKGHVVAVIQNATNGFVLAQPVPASLFGATSTANLFAAGPAANLTSYIDFKNIVRGSRSALPSMQVSDPGSLFDLDAAGNATGRVIVGDTGFTGTGNIVEDSTGAQYYVSGGTLYKFAAGKSTSLIGPGFKSPDGTLITPTRAYAANTQGGVVFDCGTNAADGHIRLYLYRNGSLTQVLRSKVAFSNAQLLTWPEAAVDAGGRVAAIVSLDNGFNELALFDGKTTSVVSSARVSSLAGEHVAGFSQLRGIASAFYVRVALTAEFTHATVASFSGTSLTPLVKSGDALPDGTILGDFRLADVNAKGDVIFAGTVDTAGTQMLGFRSATGEIRFVCSNNQQLETGDNLTRFSDINLRDDGTVYFLAFDVNDRALVFQANPL